MPAKTKQNIDPWQFHLGWIELELFFLINALHVLISVADLYFIWVNKYQQCYNLTYYSHSLYLFLWFFFFLAQVHPWPFHQCCHIIQCTFNKPRIQQKIYKMVGGLRLTSCLQTCINITMRQIYKLYNCFSHSYFVFFCFSNILNFFSIFY